MNVLTRLMMSLSGKRPAIRIRPSVPDASEADSQLTSAFDAVGGPNSVAAAQHLLTRWEEEDRCRAMTRSQTPPHADPSPL